MKKTYKPLAIHLQNVGKKYEIHHEKPTLVEKFINGNKETFWALKGINLSIQKGERIGIIGPNGSGKTTLLKIIAGISTPTTGMVTTNGKTVALIDLEAGFHPDLSGYQNIYLSGMLLGLSKNAVTRLIPSIISYAEINQFIDAPLFTYSNGMALRLGFSIAIHAYPDILLLDESLNAGDAAFREKAKNTLLKLFYTGITVVVVSQSTEFIKAHCDRILLMSSGTVIGTAEKRLFEPIQQLGNLQ